MSLLPTKDLDLDAAREETTNKYQCILYKTMLKISLCDAQIFLAKYACCAAVFTLSRRLKVNIVQAGQQELETFSTTKLFANNSIEKP